MVILARLTSDIVAQKRASQDLLADDFSEANLRIFLVRMTLWRHPDLLHLDRKSLKSSLDKVIVTDSTIESRALLRVLRISIATALFWRESRV
jgi:hypothetical protein